MFKCQSSKNKILSNEDAYHRLHSLFCHTERSECISEGLGKKQGPSE